MACSTLTAGDTGEPCLPAWGGPTPSRCPPDRLLLAKPEVWAVRQGAQSKTPNQSHHPSHPSHPLLPAWGTMETLSP